MPTLSELLEQMQQLLTNWLTYIEGLRNWMLGTVDGGPNGDGYYPLTDSTGYSILVPCPVKMRQIAATLEIATLSGPTFALDAAQSGNRIHINRATVTNVTIPNAAVGTIWYPRQIGAGALKFVGAAGVTIVNRRGHNGTAGQGAGVSISIETAGVAYLDGDTAIVA